VIYAQGANRDGGGSHPLRMHLGPRASTGRTRGAPTSALGIGVPVRVGSVGRSGHVRFTFGGCSPADAQRLLPQHIGHPAFRRLSRET
jgi:hypothetical protein